MTAMATIGAALFCRMCVSLVSVSVELGICFIIWSIEKNSAALPDDCNCLYFLYRLWISILYLMSAIVVMIKSVTSI